MDSKVKLRIVFMGSPDFAIPVLSSILHAGHDVVGVYTKPDKPAGRGNQQISTPVKLHAMNHGIRIFQPPSLRTEKVRSKLTSLSPQLIVVAAYGLLLPKPILDTPTFGCLNIHPSLLPKYRGPSPVASAILNGATITGVTLMRINQEVDSGPIISSHETCIHPDENTKELTAKLFEMGALLLVKTLPELVSDPKNHHPQNESEATFTKRISKKDGEIDWGQGADQISRQIKAYTPWPGSFTKWRNKLLKIIEASASPIPTVPDTPPGLVVSLPETEIGIMTGDGTLKITQLQLSGKRVTSAKDFQSGYPEFIGSNVR